MRVVLLLAFLTIAKLTFSQDTTHFYLDESGAQVTTADKASINIKVFPCGNLWCVEKVAIAGGLVFEKITYKDKSLAEMHGMYSSYYANGYLQETGVFQDGKRDGLWKQFYLGVLTDSVFFNKGVRTEYYIFTHGKLTESMIRADGNIHTTLYWPHGPIKNVVTIDAKGLTSVVEYDNKGVAVQKLLHTAGGFQKVAIASNEGKAGKKKFRPVYPPEFSGGEQAFQRYIDREIKIPAAMRYKYLYPCKFTCVMEFDESGVISQFRITKSINVDFDNTIMQSLKRMPPWNMNGLKSHTQVLTINFVDE